MSRRDLLFASIAFLLMRWVPRPARAIVWGIAARVLGRGLVSWGARAAVRGARLASRSSRVYSRGLSSRSLATRTRHGRFSPPRSAYTTTARATPKPSATSRPNTPAGSYGPRRLTEADKAEMRRNIDASLRKLDDDITRKDRERYAKNMLELIDNMMNVADLRDALEFMTHWDDTEQTVAEHRAHFRACPQCEDALQALIRGTDIDYIPEYQEKIVVTARHTATRPGRREANKRNVVH